MKKAIFYLLLFPFLVSASNADEPSVRAYFKKGNTFFDNGLYQKAIENYSKVIDFEPSNIKAYFNRGLANQKLGLYDQAIKDFTRIIELKSDYIQAYFERGNVYFDKGLNKEAIEDYSKTLEINPDDVSSLFNRGLAYKRMKNYKAAYQDFKKVCDSGNEGACKIAKELSTLIVSKPPSPVPDDIEKPVLAVTKQPALPPVSPGRYEGLKEEKTVKVPGCPEGLLDLGDGTVKDCESGLIWVKDITSSGEIKNWSESVTHVHKLKYKYCKNWRLPTRDEFRALSESLHLYVNHPFINIKNGFYWTGEEHDTEQAWIVYLFPYSDERINTKKNTFCIILPVCLGK